MDIQRIYELMEQFDRSGLEELELELEGAKVHMVKPSCRASLPAEQVPTGQQTLTGQMAEPALAQPIAAPAMDQAALKPAAKELKAPLAGTFYTAPGPDEAPFVVIGQQIHKGDTIGIIEAMKLMNTIVAEEDGIVEEIAAENGSLVAYDEVLIRYV